MSIRPLIGVLGLAVAAVIVAAPIAKSHAGSPAKTTVAVTINGVYATQGVRQNSSINSRVLTNRYVDGIVLQYSWAVIEPRDAVFNWKPVDSQIAQAEASGKKIALSVTAGYQSPSWLYAEGAEGFQFVWDKPSWGPPPCSVQTIPVPWDPIFLARWTAFVQAFGARYGSNPAVSNVKVTGLNSKTSEISLPLSVNAPINGGQCTSFNDVADWQAVGYTRTKVEAAWQQIANSYQASFPDKQFTAELVPGFPPIDDDGNIIPRATADYQVSADIISNGIADYGLQFVGQNNGLSATWIWPTLVSVSGQIDTGYQMVGVMGNNLQAAVTLAVQSNAKFLEIYTTDILNPKLQSVLASAHQSLQ